MNTLFAHVPLLSQITVSDSPIRICLFSEGPFILAIIEDTSLQTQPLDKRFWISAEHNKAHNNYIDFTKRGGKYSISDLHNIYIIERYGYCN